MAVQYAFSQITTTGLKLAVDAADPLSYPGSGTTWTDVTGNGFTGTISSSISFATTNRGALVSSNSASAVSFSGSAADFGTGSFTIEMAFSPSQINGRHWLYSKNSGSFPNFGAFITGSGGSGRITAFYNISSTVSSSTTTAVGSIVTGSNYVLDVTYIPGNVITSVYLNSNYIASGSANGTGSLSTSASLLLLNNTTASSAGTMGNLYNFKVYNPYINSSNIRKNYNSMCSRFGLPLALYTPPAPFLLDLYSGAAAAYSLRKLTNFYGGSAIRVRRSSDNTEQDIGFDGNGDLNTSALLSFCGAGNGFIVTWYDQSENARHATQSTATNQPQIVSSGNIIYVNSKPAISFDGTDDSLLNTTLTATSTQSVFYVKKGANLNGNSAVLGFPTTDAATQLGIYYWNSSPFDYGFNTWNGDSWGFSGANTDFLNQTLEMALFLNGNPTSSGVKLFINNSQKTLSQVRGTSVSRTMADGLRIGQGGQNDIQNFDGWYQEIVIWSADYSSTNRTQIQSNINSYYSIY